MPIIIGMQLRCDAALSSTNTFAPARLHWERTLLERIARSDKEALAKLYDCYAGEVYAMALAGTGDRALAEAVTVETFAEIWATPERFRASAIPLSKWLLAIALRRTRRARR